MTVEDVTTQDDLKAALDDLFETFGPDTTDKLVGDDVVVPNLTNVARYIVIEVLDDEQVDEEDEVEIRVTSAGLTGPEFKDLIGNLFLQVNG